MKSLIIITRTLKFQNRTIFCDKEFVKINLLCFRKNQNQAFNNYQRDISDIVTKNINLFNKYYERFFGIAEVRQIQAKVLETEGEFVDITRKRKSCQDKIDEFKENIKSLREKLDTLPRSSDNYLNLITTEHKLLREQLSLEAQLSQLKEREQIALDSFSALLRQSHEVERLRQDRSKYWQIITAAITTVGYTVALIAQKSRSQKSLSKKLEALRLELSDEKQSFHEKLDLLVESQQKSELRIDIMQKEMSKLIDNLNVKRKASEKQANHGWTSYIPGLNYLQNNLAHWFYYQR